MNPQTQEQLRALPSVDDLLHHPEVESWIGTAGHDRVVLAIREVIENHRQSILEGSYLKAELESILDEVEDKLVTRLMPALRRVINATGIVLHTGLGRAPLCESAMDALANGAAGYCNLEYDLESGKRNQRTGYLAERLCDITGAEAAFVVNNNAAATLLILSTLANGKEAIVSRGQLVEIGGSYRLPTIMEASGAILREVGATNRTHLRDYEKAIGSDTGLLLRVHTSNYRIMGFSNEVPIEEMVSLGHSHGLPVVDDLGSGAMFDLSRFGLPSEPNIRRSIEAGADLVCFSGDKLLGGPQMGIILGRKSLIARLRENPLSRCLRVDKLALLAMEATLEHHGTPEDAIRNIPVLSMLAESTDTLARKARKLCEKLVDALPDESFFVCSDVAFTGGGALPAREIPTVIVQWKPRFLGAEQIAAELRTGPIPVVARIQDEAICFDVRTIQETDIDDLVMAACNVASVDSDDIDDEEDGD